MNDEGSIGLAAWRRESLGMESAHRHLDLEINYVLQGTMQYLAGGRLVDVPPRRICLLWGGVPHQMIRNRTPVEALWATVPLADVLRWRLPDALVRPLLATGFILDPTPRSGDLEMLTQWVEDLAGSAGEEIVLLEVEARLRRLAQGLTAPHEPGASTSQNRSVRAVETMARFVSERFQAEIGAAEIAGAAYLHPNYAMTLFRRHTGLTLSQYLTLQRVAHAQRLLLTTDTAIASIALESGFGSISRFYEAFKRQAGSSPRRFRERAFPGLR